MIEVLSVSANRINESHIESLIASKVPEGEQIEFKEGLPAKSGEKDPWMSGGNRIGDRAKNAILEEVVAFANAYGGVLLLGIKESDAKPAAADRMFAGSALRGFGGTPGNWSFVTAWSRSFPCLRFLRCRLRARMMAVW